MFQPKEGIVTEEDAGEIREEMQLLRGLGELENVPSDRGENLVFEAMVSLAAQHPDQKVQKKEGGGQLQSGENLSQRSLIVLVLLGGRGELRALQRETVRREGVQGSREFGGPSLSFVFAELGVGVERGEEGQQIEQTALEGQIELLVDQEREIHLGDWIELLVSD